MTYPQPSSVDPVLGGQEFFRLNTLVASPGDIYESEVGSLGLAVGPDSDFANYVVFYYDENNATSVSQLSVSPDRDTLGRVDARNEIVYPGAGSRRGRILISLGDIYDPSILPSQFNIIVSEDSIEYVTPVIDVLQYFINEPSVTPQRSDREYRFEYMKPPVVATKSSYIIVPTYGRKSGCMTVTNNDGTNIVTTSVYGMKLTTNAAAAQSTLYTAAIAAAGGQGRFSFVSSTQGIWDVWAIRLANYHAASMPIQITLSDDAE